MTVGTVGVWMKGGGASFWDADCIAALIACGINPDACGKYSELQDALGKAREGHRKKRCADAADPSKPDHEPNCQLKAAPGAPRTVKGTTILPASTAPGKTPRPVQFGDCSCYESTSPTVLAEMGALTNKGKSATPEETWLLANSEAGHIMQDSYARSGKRGNPCNNVIPGYRPDDSFTVLHHGEASTHGMHRAVTLAENQQAADLKVTNPDGSVPVPAINAGIERTADMTVRHSKDGSRGTGGAGLDGNIATSNSTRPDWSETADQRRAAMTEKMKNTGPVGGTQALYEKTEAYTQNGPNGPEPTEAAIQKAAKCISDKAKQATKEMQKDTVNQNSTVSATPECQAAVAKENQARANQNRRRQNRGQPPLPEAKGFADLKPAEQQKVLAATQAQVAARQAALNAKPPASRTPDECLEMQGNDLAGAMGANNGAIPDFAGRQPRM